MTVGTSKITEKGQVTIPADIRKSMGLDIGTSVVFVEMDDGVLIKSEKSIRESLMLFERRGKQLGLTREQLAKEIKEVRKKRWAENA